MMQSARTATWAASADFGALQRHRKVPKEPISVDILYIYIYRHV